MTHPARSRNPKAGFFRRGSGLVLFRLLCFCSRCGSRRLLTVVMVSAVLAVIMSAVGIQSAGMGEGKGPNDGGGDKKEQRFHRFGALARRGVGLLRSGYDWGTGKGAIRQPRILALLKEAVSPVKAIVAN